MGWRGFADATRVPFLLVAGLGGMGLAGFRRVMMRVMAMARRRVGVMGGGFHIVVFEMPGGFAMMVRRLFVMVGGMGVVLADGVFLGHLGVPLDAASR